MGGNIKMEKGRGYDMTFDDRISPPLRALVGRSILLQCEENNAFPKKICAPITMSSLSFSANNEESTTMTAGGGMAIFIVILLFITIPSVYFYSKKQEKLKNAEKENNDNTFAALPNASKSAISVKQNSPTQSEKDKVLEFEEKNKYIPPQTDRGNNAEIVLPDNGTKDVVKEETNMAPPPPPISYALKEEDVGHGENENVDNEEYEYYEEQEVETVDNEN